MQRRKFLKNTLVSSTVLGWQQVLPAWAQSSQGSVLSAITGKEIDLHVSQVKSRVAGKSARHIRINDQFPAPLLRWREGDEQTLRVHNSLDEATSIHWHGVLLPYQMDGVPGVSFPGIAAGDSFTYRFALKQSGTYWYHSHSGMQEQLGHYGPIIIDPAKPEAFTYDREYVILLSDWTFENPQRVFSRLKKMSDSYNFQQRTLGDFFRDVKSDGLNAALSERMLWGDMRMSRTDLSDVTGATYTYLVNGHSPAENWTGIFRPGERIRLRFINAAAMSIFNVRIPGLPMTIVAADGLPVKPVEIDEFQIGNAETYDVLITPPSDQAYTIMAETNDFFAYAAATLAPRQGMRAKVPPLRKRPLLGMKDMGMDHSAMSTEQAEPEQMNHAEMNHAQPMQAHRHALGPGVVNVAMNPLDRLHERPLGLEQEAHRVLVYTDLQSAETVSEQRSPERELELHLTSNMERYMWSFDGLKFSEVAGPVQLYLNERIRMTFVNDTMMPHPVHLHGMFFELVNGHGRQQPRKHTLVIKPAEKVSIDVTADAEGLWAFHCHLLYHMHAGMMRVFSVGKREEQS